MFGLYEIYEIHEIHERYKRCVYTRIIKKGNAVTLPQTGNEWRYSLGGISQGNGQGENITAVFCFEWRMIWNVNI